MIAGVATLLEQLDARGIGYCHWKSNWAQDVTLDGSTDIDILVRRSQADAFRALMVDLGYRPAVEAGVPPFPSVEHFHGLDEPSSQIVDVHVYYRIVTGGSLAKNYRLPLEEMLLGRVRRLGPLVVPTAGAETIVFLVRLFLKLATPVETLLLRRHWDDVEAEAAWLIDDTAIAEAHELAREHLPVLDDGLIDDALAAVCGRAGLLRRIRVARRVKRRLRPYARRSPVSVAWTNAVTLGLKVRGRLRGTKVGLTPGSGGAVIAFVGSEAAGKSTTLDAVAGWLATRYTVEQVHVGKPPSTLLTRLPNTLLPALRKLVPGQRSTAVSLERSTSSGTAKAPPLLFAIRALLLAIDRRALLVRACRRAASGTIVLCDRFPSDELGALDGAQLDPAAVGQGRLLRWLAEREAACYAAVQPPDLVVYLVAPLEVTLARNATRSKVEDADYVRARYARSISLRFDRAVVRRIDTDRDIEDVQREVRRAIWETL